MTEYAPIKPAYILTDGNLDHIGIFPKEYKSKSSALTFAKAAVDSDPENEVWVWKLSHVVGMPNPTMVPEVTKVLS